MRRLLRLACPLVLASAAGAQATVEEALGDNAIADLFSALLNVTLSDDLVGASYRVDNGGQGSSNTHFSTYKLPWSREIDVGSAHGTLHVEASGGLLLAEDGFEIDTPSGLATVDQDWLTAGAQLGAGWTFPLPHSWYVRPGAALALSYIENDADYNAAGKIEIAPQIDGLLVNWDAWASIVSASLTAGRERDPAVFSAGLRGHYALASTHVFSATDSVQEGRDRSEFLGLRGELGGPTSWSLHDEPLGWDVFGGWAGLLEVDRDALGFDEVYELGLELTLRVSKKIAPLGLSAAWLTGPDIRGVSLGLSLGGSGQRSSSQ